MGWLSGKGPAESKRGLRREPPRLVAGQEGAEASGASETDLAERLFVGVRARIAPEYAVKRSRGELVREVKAAVVEILSGEDYEPDLLEQRNLVSHIINRLISQAPRGSAPEAPLSAPAASNGQAGTPVRALNGAAQRPSGVSPRQAAAVAEAAVLDYSTPCAPNGSSATQGASFTSIESAKRTIQPHLMERIDASVAAAMTRVELSQEMHVVVGELLAEHGLTLNRSERERLIAWLLDDMLGLGPLEPLLADEAITDIMVNGPKQVYVERGGKLELTNVVFRDNSHVLSIATRIVTAIGRRVDESTPLVDARLADGSRVNIIIPPLAIDGPSISIRKFAKKKITLEIMEAQENLSSAMASVLRIAGRARLNILISGGTGSGKTTLLNAISRMIDPGERVVTIEDAAELQLQQPHVVRLETRTANLEGGGAIDMRDLVKNALRMRPDRIILGECRGSEAIDMLQAMNTGHDGSFSTIHANRPREALMRLENMVGMAGLKLSSNAIRTQIASAIDLIVQVSRMRDGKRRITHIAEIVGMEGDVITMQELFTYEFHGEDERGNLLGNFKSAGLRPHFAPKAAYFGLEKALLEAV